jgi:hypothetical protein
MRFCVRVSPDLFELTVLRLRQNPVYAYGIPGMEVESQVCKHTRAGYQVRKKLERRGGVVRF